MLQYVRTLSRMTLRRRPATPAREANMRYIKIGLVILAALLAAACAGDPVGDSPDHEHPVVLKVAQNSSLDHPYQAGLEAFKQALERETDGAVIVNIFPSGQLGSEEQEIVGIKLGVIDATIVSSGNLAPFVPEIDLFNLPFIFRDQDHFYRVLDGPVGQWMGGVIEEKVNGVMLGYCSFGTRNAWNAKRPVLTPEDFKGLKIRVMGSPILLSTFNAFGAQATTMSWNELYSALQQGVLDGAECGMVDLLVEKFYEVTRHVSLTNHLIGAATLIFSRKKYDLLPPFIQTAVLQAGREAVLAARRAEDDFSSRARRELEEKGLEFTEVDKEIFRERVRSVYTRYAPRLGGMELIEQINRQ